ncbi:Protein Y4C6B.5 [Aphelenchoides avenae]|nr:Protein Y4C6B.5 [Aphelenchus avenae]
MEWASKIGMEPPMFLYMCTSFIKFPVFQGLLFEKACISRYGAHDPICSNMTVVHANKELQADENHLFLISSLCLLLPAIPTALLLGSLMDIWHVKIPMMIPFVGLILGDVNYIVQCALIDLNPYWLLISDVVFGICGGFNAIIGTLIAYGVKTTPTEYRSERIAAFEGAIGLGTTLGYAVSGVLREAVGYAWTFAVMTAMHVAAIIYIYIVAKPIQTVDHDEGVPSTEAAFHGLWRRLADIPRLFTSMEDRRRLWQFVAVLVALGIELLVFAGVNDILFSFFRYRLQWADKQYGWFNGLGSAFSTVAILLLYPFLHRKLGIRNTLLSIFGTLTKIVHMLILAFVQATWMAFLATIPITFNRFVATGTRALASQYVLESQQGRLFALVALLEGASFTIASLIFNGLYPMTLNFFSGTMFLAVAASMLVVLACLV